MTVNNGAVNDSEANGRRFLALGEQGKAQGWRYIAGALIIIVTWIILGSLPFVAHALMSAQGPAGPGAPLTFFILLNLSFVPLLAGTALVVRIVHRRPAHTLITPCRSLDWRQIGVGFVVFGGLVLAGGLSLWALGIYSYSVTTNPAALALFVPAVLILTPIQTTAEELFFRGYLAQAVGRISRNPVFVIIVTGVIFTVPHLWNPEMASGPLAMALGYFAIGAFFMFITLWSGTLELALGAHAANNIVVGLIINTPQSALTTESVLTLRSQMDAQVELAVLLIQFLLFVLIVRRLVPARPAPPPG